MKKSTLPDLPISAIRLKMNKVKIMFIAALIFTCVKAVADEGTWLPSLIYKLNICDMQSKGLKLSAEAIYSINNSSLKDAVVVFGEGCTAELISGDGLLLTAHHCGYNLIQNHSSIEHNYLDDGFWAKSRGEELPNSGISVSFLIRAEDVTDKVLANVSDKMSEKERLTAVEKASEKLEMEAKGSTHYDTYVKSLFESNKYYLFVTETFSDVRLVGAPPLSLGKFGGDTDNFMWPRHTNDFSLFRIYCSPDGKPADYSKNNVAYHPKHFFPISLRGVKEGDYSMIMGYPLRSYRYKTSFWIDNKMKVTNQVIIKVREEKLRILSDIMAIDPKARLQYSGKQFFCSNGYKFSSGENKSLEILKIIEKRKALETRFTDWVNAENERKDKYGTALQDIEASNAQIENGKAQIYITEALLDGPELFSFAFKAKPLLDALSNSEKNKTEISRIISDFKMTMDLFYKDLDAATDEKLATSLVKMFADNNDLKYYPDFINDIQKTYKGDYSKYFREVYETSVFTDKDRLTQFLEQPSMKALKKDPAFNIGCQIMDKSAEINELVSADRHNLDRGNRLFVAGLMEMQKDRNFYPDANYTMRLTFGSVMDYEPRDGVIYKYYTTSDGYLQKEIPGDIEFDVPARMKQLLVEKDFGEYADTDGTLHTCFLSDTDTFGGNSGSPVLNANGEMTGILFDGNWEGLSGDVVYDQEMKRSINVDIRFVLWVIDKYAGATNLISELKLVK